MQAVSWGNSPAPFARQAFVSANPMGSTISPQREINTDFKSGVPNMGKSLRFAGNGQVTILSWNVKGQYMGINPDGSINKKNPAFQARVRVLKRIIEDCNPEILGFQECPHNLLRAFQEELGELYPHIFYGTPGSIPMRLQVGMLVRHDVGVDDSDVTSPRLRKNGRGILRGKFHLEPELKPEQIIYVEVGHDTSLVGDRTEPDPVKRAEGVKAKKLDEAKTHAALVKADMDKEAEETGTILPRFILKDWNLQDDELGRQVMGIFKGIGLKEAEQVHNTYHDPSGRHKDARFDRGLGPKDMEIELRPYTDFDDADIKKAKADHLPMIFIGPAYAIQRETQRHAVAVAFGSARRMDFVA